MHRDTSSLDRALPASSRQRAQALMLLIAQLTIRQEALIRSFIEITETRVLEKKLIIYPSRAFVMSSAG